MPVPKPDSSAPAVVFASGAVLFGDDGEIEAPGEGTFPLVGPAVTGRIGPVTGSTAARVAWVNPSDSVPSGTAASCATKVFADCVRAAATGVTPGTIAPVAVTRSGPPAAATGLAVASTTGGS